MLWLQVANTPAKLTEEFIGSDVQTVRMERAQLGFRVTGSRVLTRRLSGLHFSIPLPLPSVYQPPSLTPASLARLGLWQHSQPRVSTLIQMVDAFFPRFRCESCQGRALISPGGATCSLQEQGVHGGQPSTSTSASESCVAGATYFQEEKCQEG